MTMKIRILLISILGLFVSNAYSQCAVTANFNYSYTDCSTIQFVDNSIPAPNYNLVQWDWDFGDGNTGSGQVVSHTFVPGAVVTVEVTVTADSSGVTCTDVYSVPITIRQLPDVFVSSNPNPGCIDEPVSFFGSSGFNIISWSCDFGDGTSSSQQNPVHTYTSAGSYDVILTVTDINGCITTLDPPYVQDIGAIPDVDFTWDPSPGCLDAPIQFTGTSAATIATWQWNFGDGGTAFQQNPMHTYNTPGVYTVTLLVTSTDGCTNSTSRQVMVNPLPNPSFTSTSPACASDTVHFTNLSTSPNGFINQWIWDFGDGNTTTVDFPDDPNVSHLYANGGTFEVFLTVTDSDGCQNTTSRLVQVIPNPVADFTFLEDCFGDPVLFTDLSSPNGGPDLFSWSWDFGDPSSGVNNFSTLPSPSHIFTAPGTFTVTLIVTNTQGCADTAMQDITVAALPNVDFTMANDTVCFGEIASFTGTGSNVISWVWDFGDGGTATGPSPTHLYSQPGTYTVTLIGTGTDGCMNSISHDIFIRQNPVADFSFVSGCLTDSVYFTDQSTSNVGYIASWNWDFGDGSASSNLQNPAHLYANSGTYNVQLDVVDEFGCTHSIIQTVEVAAAPTADFDYNEYCLGNETEFFDNSELNGGSVITTWQWNFGDPLSGDNTSDLQNPTHIFTDAGTFTVTLIVSNTDGCSDTTAQDIIVDPLPVVNFTMTNDTICLGETLQFNGTGTNVTFWNWDFGDGVTDNIQNPIHLYTTTGTFTVTLTGTSSDGCSNSISQDIVVREVPTADFLFNDVCLGDTTYFQDQSSANVGFINGWNWDFGDGSTSDLQNPSHLYTVAGVFDVSLIAFDSFGCTDTIVQTVQVFANPNADFIYQETCLGDSVYFNDNSNNNNGPDIISWSWVFDDPLSGVNNFSDLQNPSHLFTGPGTYDVSLVVTNEQGCFDSIVQNIVIDTLPDIDFTITNDTICLWEIAEFFSINNGPISIASWYWDFGDGIYSNDANPIHLYTQAGFYTVTLTGTGADGCESTVSKTILVRESPVADFDYNNSCFGDSIQFLDQSYSNQANIVSWDWTFGDGDTDTLQNPIHFYQAPGSYNVSLIVFNEFGCSDTTNRIIQIFDNPSAAFTFNLECDTSGQVTFFDDSQAGNDSPIDSWTWDFGDGYTSSEINPVHIYNFTDSCYNVVLTIVDTNGCTSVDTNLVCVRDKLSIDFTASEICFGEATFFDADFLPLNDTIVYFRWDFGNGTPFYTSPEDTVSYTYDNPGTYRVVLTALDIYGCSATYVDTISVNELPIPDFRYIMSTCEEPAQFIDESDGMGTNIASWSWDFGDYSSGINNFSNLQNPTHTYPPDDSTYQVKLIVTNFNGCVDSIVKTIVRTPCLDAEIYLPDHITCDGSEICFADSSVIYSNYMEITEWEWDFGDGNTLTYDFYQNPICHTYDASGTYEASLIVTAQSGQNILKDTAFQTVIVGPIPAAGFAVTGATCFESLTQFSDLSEGNGADIDQWWWDFGDDTNPDDTSSLQNPTYIYPSAGVYDVQLVVTSIYGCTDTIFNTIEIFDRPEANFSNTVGCVDHETFFFDESIESGSAISNWHWNFGDPTSLADSSDRPNPVYIYNEEGIYNVSLIVLDNNFCSDTVEYDVEVYERPVAAFEVFEQYEVQQGEIYLNNQSVGATTYFWDFGNGEVSEEENPVVQYSEDGFYTITLIAYGENGCPDTTSVEYEMMFKTLYVPNAFIPGNLGWTYEDGRFIVKGVNLSRYRIQVFDAWGDLIWESDALIDGRPAASWNGRNEGNPNLDLCPAGAYTWKIDAVFKDGTKWKGSDNGDGNTKPYGTVTLIR